jgi:hypothetical protein
MLQKSSQITPNWTRDRISALANISANVSHRLIFFAIALDAAIAAIHFEQMAKSHSVDPSLTHSRIMLLLHINTTK